MITIAAVCSQSIAQSCRISTYTYALTPVIYTQIVTTVTVSFFCERRERKPDGKRVDFHV